MRFYFWLALTAGCWSAMALPATGSWQRFEMGSGETFYDVTVTAGRNGSDTTYLYASCSNGYVDEFFWNGSSWQGGTIGTQVSGNMRGIASGMGRNDGNMKIVAVQSDGRLNEYAYTTTWAHTSYNYGNTFYYCTSGQGRNGNTNTYIYAGNSNGNIVEFAWNGSAYLAQALGTAGGDSCYSVSVGNGRNDGVSRVYGANWDNNIYEYTWNGAAWIRSTVGTQADDFNGVKVGAARNGSSVNYVYGGWDSGQVVEYAYSGGVWS